MVMWNLHISFYSTNSSRMRCRVGGDLRDNEERDRDLGGRSLQETGLDWEPASDDDGWGGCAAGFG